MLKGNWIIFKPKPHYDYCFWLKNGNRSHTVKTAKRKKMNTKNNYGILFNKLIVPHFFVVLALFFAFAKKKV